MAAGLTVPAGRGRCTRCTRTSCGPGDPHEEIRYAVDRIRDGRSFSTRRVVAWQRRKGEDVAIFALTADFHAGEKAVAEHSLPMPDVPRPGRAAPASAEMRGPARRPRRRRMKPWAGRSSSASSRTRSTAPPKTPPDTQTCDLDAGGRPAARRRRRCTPRR